MVSKRRGLDGSRPKFQGRPFEKVPTFSQPTLLRCNALASNRTVEGEDFGGLGIVQLGLVSLLGLKGCFSIRIGGGEIGREFTWLPEVVNK